MLEPFWNFDLNKKYLNSNTIGNYNTYIDDNNYHIEIPLAGYTNKEIEVSIHDDELVVIGKKEKKENNYQYHGYNVGNFKKTFLLNFEFEKNSLKAKLDNGILNIVLPLKESSKPITINVE